MSFRTSSLVIPDDVGKQLGKALGIDLDGYELRFDSRNKPRKGYEDQSCYSVYDGNFLELTKSLETGAGEYMSCRKRIFLQSGTVTEIMECTVPVENGRMIIPDVILVKELPLEARDKIKVLLSGIDYCFPKTEE